MIRCVIPSSSASARPTAVFPNSASTIPSGTTTGSTLPSSSCSPPWMTKRTESKATDTCAGCILRVSISAKSMIMYINTHDTLPEERNVSIMCKIKRGNG